MSNKSEWKKTKLIRVGDHYHQKLKTVSVKKLESMTRIVEQFIEREFAKYDSINSK